MRRIFQICLSIAMLLGMVGYALPAYASTSLSFSTNPIHNYTVLVGSENTSMGVSIMSFFPQNVSVHVGDTITWKVNSHEIHTVTFLAGNPLPEIIIPAPPGMASPLQINPLAAFPVEPADGQYDGSTYVNSGIMSSDPGFVQTFSLTFTQEGVYDYICVVHGQLMSGKVTVVGDNETIPSPAQVIRQGLAELRAAWMNVPSVLAQANAQAVPPVENPDGTFTHTITVGYMSGQIMVMDFFSDRELVRPGDTVVWQLSPTNDAPHTVTFYNGAPDLSFVMVVPGPDGPVALINPAVLYPSDAVLNGTPLNKTDFFNSGILMPGGQTTFSLIIGSFYGANGYECILHDTSGMVGNLVVMPRHRN